MCAGSRNGPVISVKELQMVREMVVRAIGVGEIEGGVWAGKLVGFFGGVGQHFKFAERTLLYAHW